MRKTILLVVIYTLRQSKMGVITGFLLCMPILCSAMFAQHDSRPLTVEAAKDSATRLGSSEIVVRGHFWLGKEGSMIYDAGYKAVLRLQYTEEFHLKHSYQELLGEARKSDTATITGRLHFEPNGRLVLIADDIQFAEKPQ